MKRTKTSLVALLIIWLGACTQQEPGQVQVENGTIRGTVTEDLTIYKGIPFAAPPVGDLRWKAPQPVEDWEWVK
ncbi:MAG: carboxylesterase family protein [Marinilabilia sp.]